MKKINVERIRERQERLRGVYCEWHENSAEKANMSKCWPQSPLADAERLEGRRGAVIMQCQALVSCICLS